MPITVSRCGPDATRVSFYFGLWPADELARVFFQGRSGEIGINASFC
jgi:hypothetical protein